MLGTSFLSSATVLTDETNTMKLSPTVFLDLLGTLGGDGLSDITSFEFFPRAIDALVCLKGHGFLAIVLTNHSRIAKGWLTEAQYNEHVKRLESALREANAKWNAIYCCPHQRSDGCDCKKPKRGLVNRAMKDFNIDQTRSYVVGDNGANDMRLARNIGAKGVLILTGVGQGSLGEYRHLWADVEPVHIADDILDAVEWIGADLEVLGN